MLGPNAVAYLNLDIAVSGSFEEGVCTLCHLKFALCLSRNNLHNSSCQSSVIPSDILCCKDGTYHDILKVCCVRAHVSMQVKCPNQRFNTLYDEWLYYRSMSFNGTVQPSYASVN